MPDWLFKKVYRSVEANHQAADDMSLPTYLSLELVCQVVVSSSFCSEKCHCVKKYIIRAESYSAVWIATVFIYILQLLRNTFSRYFVSLSGRRLDKKDLYWYWRDCTGAAENNFNYTTYLWLCKTTLSSYRKQLDIFLPNRPSSVCWEDTEKRQQWAHSLPHMLHISPKWPQCISMY